MRATRSSERGFTLWEVIVAGAAALVMSAVSLPMVTATMEAHRLRAASQAVGARCRQARFLAVSSNLAYRVQCNGSALELQKQSGGSFNTVEIEPLPQGVSFQSCSASPVFSARGTVTPAGTLVLANSRGRTRQVTVSLLGLVREQ